MEKQLKEVIINYGYPTLCVIEQEYFKNFDRITRLIKALRPFVSEGSILLVLKENNTFELLPYGIKWEKGIRTLPEIWVEYIRQKKEFNPFEINVLLQPIKSDVASDLAPTLEVDCLVIKVKEGNLKGDYTFFLEKKEEKNKDRK